MPVRGAGTDLRPPRDLRDGEAFEAAFRDQVKGDTHELAAEVAVVVLAAHDLAHIFRSEYVRGLLRRTCMRPLTTVLELGGFHEHDHARHRRPGAGRAAGADHDRAP